MPLFLSPESQSGAAGLSGWLRNGFHLPQQERPSLWHSRRQRACNVVPSVPRCVGIAARRSHFVRGSREVGCHLRNACSKLEWVAEISLAMKTAFVLLVVALITPQAAAQTPRSQRATTSAATYESVDIDTDGNLRILTSEKRTIIVPKGSWPKAGESFGEQTAFEKPVISDDGRAVGAQAMFRNCCTSYDIPLQLVIYSSGKTHRFEGRLAIFDWHFADGGRRVVFSQQAVHSACVVHWE